MVDAVAPFTMVTFDASGVQRTTSAVGGESAAAAWEAAIASLPAGTAALALYDGKGVLVRVGVVPPEPLTDDPDVTAAAMDATGALVLTGHADGNLRLWNVDTGDPLWTRAPADEPIDGVAFVEGASWVMAWGDDGPLLVMDRDSGELVTRIDEPQVGHFEIAVSRSTDEVACTGGRVTRFALPSGQVLPPLDVAIDAVSPAEAQTEEVIAREPGRGVRWVNYLPDEATVVGVRVGDVTEVVFWDRVGGERLASIVLDHDVAACDLSPDASVLALAGGSEPVRLTLMDTRTRDVAHRAELPGRGVLDLRFSPDGNSIVMHDEGEGVLRLDAATGALRASMPEGADVAMVVPREEPVVPEEKESAPIMVTHSLTGSVELTPLVPPTPLGPVGRSISADGARYATVPYSIDNNYVAVFDLRRNVGLATLAHAGNVQEIWFSPDGARVAVRAAGHVTLWRLPPAPERLAR